MKKLLTFLKKKTLTIILIKIAKVDGLVFEKPFLFQISQVEEQNI